MREVFAVVVFVFSPGVAAVAQPFDKHATPDYDIVAVIWQEGSADVGFSAAAERARVAPGTEPQHDSLRRWLDTYDVIPNATGRLAASAIGEAVAFTVSGWTYARPRIYLMSPRQADRGPAVIAEGFAPQFAPDGRRLAFLSEQSGEVQVWLYDLATKERRQVSHILGGIRTPARGLENEGFGLARIGWSPDGRSIVFAHAEQGEPPGEITAAPWLKATNDGRNAAVVILSAGGPFYAARELLMTTGSRRPVQGGYGEHSRIMVLDLDTDRVQVLGASRSTHYLTPVWLPGSEPKIIALSRAYTGQGVNVRVQTRLVEIAVASGRARYLTKGEGTEHELEVSPDGRYVAFLRHSSNGDRPMSQRKLIVVDLRSGSEQDLGVDLPIKAVAWTAEDALAVVARDGLGSVLIDFSVKTGAERSRRYRAAQVSSLAWGGGPRALFFVEDAPTTPLRVWHRRDGVEHVDWTASDPFRELGVRAKYIPLRWQGKDGDLVSGMLIVPKSARGKSALVLNAYPASARWAFESSALDGTHILIDHGYAVLRINARTPHTWFSFTSREGHGVRGQGAGGLKTLVDDLDRGLAAAETTGAVDLGRVCGFGHSNGGGTLTQYIVHGKKIKCAIIVAPAGIEWWTSFVDPKSTASTINGVFAWENPDLYTLLEPLSHVNKVTAPTLLAVGEDDGLFPIQTVALFNALRYAGKETSLLMYPNQQHLFSGAAETDFWIRKLTFLKHHLK